MEKRKSVIVYMGTQFTKALRVIDASSRPRRAFLPLACFVDTMGRVCAHVDVKVREMKRSARSREGARRRAARRTRRRALGCESYRSSRRPVESAA